MSALTGVKRTADGEPKRSNSAKKDDDNRVDTSSGGAASGSGAAADAAGVHLHGGHPVGEGPAAPPPPCDEAMQVVTLGAASDSQSDGGCGGALAPPKPVDFLQEMNVYTKVFSSVQIDSDWKAFVESRREGLDKLNLKNMGDMLKHGYVGTVDVLLSHAKEGINPHAKEALRVFAFSHFFPITFGAYSLRRMRRVFNFGLWMRHKMLPVSWGYVDDPDSTVITTFHGTADVSVPSILRNGYMLQAPRKNGNVHGEGIYSTLSASYVLNELYSPAHKEKIGKDTDSRYYKSVLINRLVRGSVLEKSTPNAIIPQHEGKIYNTNFIKDNAIYVAYHGDQMYPMYSLDINLQPMHDMFADMLLGDGPLAARNRLVKYFVTELRIAPHRLKREDVKRYIGTFETIEEVEAHSYLRTGHATPPGESDVLLHKLSYDCYRMLSFLNWPQLHDTVKARSPFHAEVLYALFKEQVSYWHFALYFECLHTFRLNNVRTLEDVDARRPLYVHFHLHVYGHHEVTKNFVTDVLGERRTVDSAHYNKHADVKRVPENSPVAFFCLPISEFLCAWTTPSTLHGMSLFECSQEAAHVCECKWGNINALVPGELGWTHEKLIETTYWYNKVVGFTGKEEFMRLDSCRLDKWPDKMEGRDATFCTTRIFTRVLKYYRLLLADKCVASQVPYGIRELWSDMGKHPSVPVQQVYVKYFVPMFDKAKLSLTKPVPNYTFLQDGPLGAGLYLNIAGITVQDEPLVPQGAQPVAVGFSYSAGAAGGAAGGAGAAGAGAGAGGAGAGAGGAGGAGAGGAGAGGAGGAGAGAGAAGAEPPRRSNAEFYTSSTIYRHIRAGYYANANNKVQRTFEMAKLDDYLQEKKNGNLVNSPITAASYVIGNIKGGKKNVCSFERAWAENQVLVQVPDGLNHLFQDFRKSAVPSQLTMEVWVKYYVECPGIEKLVQRQPMLPCYVPVLDLSGKPIGFRLNVVDFDPGAVPRGTAK